MALRKHLRNGIIVEISQYEFERVVIIRVRTKGGEFKLFLELFSDGNLILVDAEGVIQQAFTFKKMRDRNILRGERFQQAPSSGKNPLRIRLSDLLELKKFKGLEVVRALTKLLSIGGMYAEEILLRAEVDKNTLCEELEDDDLKKMFAALSEIISHLETRKFEPCIIVDERGEWIDVVPIRLRRYEGFRCKKFEKFNEALDEYYAKAFVERGVTVVAEKVEQEIARQQRMLREQQEALEEARREAERVRKVGDKIYAHFHQLQAFISCRLFCRELWMKREAERLGKKSFQRLKRRRERGRSRRFILNLWTRKS